MRKHIELLFACSLAAALALSGCGPKSEDDFGGGGGGQGQKAPASLGTAVLTGKVVLKGKAPAAAKIDMSADPICKVQHPSGAKDETIVRNADGTLQNVFVYVKSGAGSYPSPASPVILEQKGCMYSPHVLGVQVGQTLQIVNDDATLHNVHCMATINDAFNLGQPSQGMKSEKTFAKPEVMVKFKCDVHSWMHCYIGVLDNPFFSVTGAEGTFKVTGLPAGTYTLEAWHEKYGVSDQAVTVKDGESQTVNFTFNAD